MVQEDPASLRNTWKSSQMFKWWYIVSASNSLAAILSYSADSTRRFDGDHDGVPWRNFQAIQNPGPPADLTLHLKLRFWRLQNSNKPWRSLASSLLQRTFIPPNRDFGGPNFYPTNPLIAYAGCVEDHAPLWLPQRWAGELQRVLWCLVAKLKISWPGPETCCFLGKATAPFLQSHSWVLREILWRFVSGDWPLFGHVQFGL